MSPDKGKNEGNKIILKQYNTKYTGIGKLIEMLSKN